MWLSKFVLDVEPFDFCLLFGSFNREIHIKDIWNNLP